MYIKFRHQERPFVLHVFIEELPDLKSKHKKFTAEAQQEITIDKSEEAKAFDITDTLPGHYIVWLRHKPTNTKLSTLVHELLHVVFWHFRYIGQSLSEDSEESYTYMLEYLINKIFGAYNNKTKSNVRKD